MATEPTAADLAKAREIALPHFGMMCCTSTAKALYEQAWDSIARALAAAREEGRAEARIVRTGDGKPIKVGDRVWFWGGIPQDKPFDWGEVSRFDAENVYLRPLQRVTWLVPELCYSTRPAAEAARKAPQ